MNIRMRLVVPALAAGAAVDSLAHEKLAVKATAGTVRIGDAKVVKADIKASNGIIHEIDTVLVPQ